MNSGSPGGFTGPHYDHCELDQENQLHNSVYSHQIYHGKFEHCKKCTHEGKFYTPYNAAIVDAESELKNITRPATRCNKFKYNPKCKKNGMCTSTFDESNPVVLAPEVCPIITNNVRKPTSSGINMPSPLPCARR